MIRVADRRKVISRTAVRIEPKLSNQRGMHAYKAHRKYQARTHSRCRTPGVFQWGRTVFCDMLGTPACEVRERLEPKPVTLPHETTPWLCPESMHCAWLLLLDTPATKRSFFTKRQQQAFAYQLARPNSVVKVKFSAEQVQSMNVCALTYKAPRATAPNT